MRAFSALAALFFGCGLIAEAFSAIRLRRRAGHWFAFQIFGCGLWAGFEGLALWGLIG